MLESVLYLNKRCKSRKHTDVCFIITQVYVTKHNEIVGLCNGATYVSLSITYDVICQRVCCIKLSLGMCVTRRYGFVLVRRPQPREPYLLLRQRVDVTINTD